jgi:hypothetical protein
MVHLHEKGQFIADIRGMYGVKYMTLSSNYDENETSLRRYETHLVESQKVTRIDTEDKPCNMNKNDETIVTCILRKFQSMLNCKIPWLNLPDASLKHCTTEEQFQNLRKLTDLINFDSEKAIWRLTGCRAHCEKQEYSLKVLESLTLYNKKKPNKESN